MNEKEAKEQRAAAIEAWAVIEVAAMLARVKRVCIMELQWQIEALGRE